MHKILLLMSGIPGSGKSYWAQHHIDNRTKYISRDEIRFSMLTDEDEYFAKEKEVFKEFCRQIDKAFETYDTVIADATHLNFASRNKTLRNIKTKLDERGYEFTIDNYTVEDDCFIIDYTQIEYLMSETPTDYVHYRVRMQYRIIDGKGYWSLYTRERVE